MKYKFTRHRKIAIVLLLIISINTLLPSAAYALTSGPAQPETKGFQPAGVSDMVDLQTGDFKYNIPLLDIDGYPINLNYASGTGMDDEASWVGLGWSLNPGAINRQLRGLPDDMSGDAVVTEDHTKPKVTVGGKATIKGEVFGNGVINGSFSLGVFNDNYTGIGAEVGANAGVSIGLTSGGGLTAGLGASILSSTASGVNASPYVNLDLKKRATDQASVTAGLSANLGYNTRSGIKDLTLGTSFGVTAEQKPTFTIKGNPMAPLGLSVDVDMGGKGSASYSAAGAVISYNSEPINPKITVPYKSQYWSYSVDAGGHFWGLYGGIGITGYKSVRQLLNPQNSNPAYGFLYSERGRDQKNALMDFVREKENPIIPELPNLALPIQMPDLFSYTSQTGSGQFRLYRGATGAFFDNEVSDASETNTAGLELGFGAYFHGSATVYHQSTSNTTRKWMSDNDYLKNGRGDFQNQPLTNPAAQHVYFKQVGEKNVDDQAVTNLLYGTRALAINNAGKRALTSFRDSTPNFASALPEGNLKKNIRALKRTDISYLTAIDAANHGFNKKIYLYPLNDSATFHPTAKPAYNDSISRVSGARKQHHISEITVTDDGGKKMVYGIPVYSLKQDEYSFAVGVAGVDYDVTNQNQVVQHGGSGPWFTNTSNIPGTGKGIDNYYHKESQPAYASSFLLSAILSPDYVDKTGNGISDDDLGTAIKFNYSKLQDTYRWRSPYQNATLNKGLLADADDDKASIVYGEKEIWYLHTIESKTKVAYFITKDRKDGLGVLDWTGGMDTTRKQRYLSEIRLYSKADMSRPIKVVKFVYNYQLCPGVPNSLAGGKLTLAKVYFEYGNSDEGKYHPYTFSYNKSVPYYGPDSLIHYTNMSSDRWGTYKSPTENGLLSFALKNDEFPYTNQNKTVVDQSAALWQLKQIVLPTGGVINVNYESDDYAYVQDKRAMVMSPIKSLIAANGADVDPTSLVDAHGIRVDISPGAPSGPNETAWFKQKYLSGSDYLYTKLCHKIATGLSNSKGQENDFISTYSKVKNVSISGTSALIMLEDRTDGDPLRGSVTANPMVMSAWQKLKDEYPRYAYPGFDSRDNGGGNAGKTVIAALGAIVNAFSNLSELGENFYQKAQRRRYASTVFLNKSFVRLTKYDGIKLGGGSRVKKIQINDDWKSMTGNNDAPSGTYGQAYDYTTIEDGKTVSSGVASYEPAVGTDENPMKQPVFYIGHIKGALSNFFDLEEPFGESLFPSATVIYGKVTVHDLDQTGAADVLQKTGYIVNEFYTAKDFPVHVHVLPNRVYENKPVSIYNLFGSNSIDEECMSQGYSIELNDMPGKSKATRVFNQSGSEISSTVSYYTDPLTPHQLKNTVDVVRPDGTIDPQRTIGRDIEFFTDFREQETVNDGQTENLGVDVIPLLFGFPVPFPHDPFNQNYEYKLFRSACALKVVQYYGVLDRVVKTENGSSITSKNIAYDQLTGEPVVTSTQNEFNKNIYSLNIPAYWVYGGMGASAQNSGMIFAGFTTNTHGEFTNYAFYLHAGDEVVDLATQNHYWVIENNSYSGSGNSKKLITRAGNIATLSAAFIKVLHSGYRNMLGTPTTSIVCLKNPIQSGHLQITANLDLTNALKVINASANTFDESWAVNSECASTGSGGTLITNSTPGNLQLAPDNGSSGTYIQLTPGATPVLYQSTFWGGVNCTTGAPRDVGDDPSGFNCGLSYRSGISLPNPYDYYGFYTDPGYNQGFETCLNITNSQYYYFGFTSYGAVSISVDGAIVATLSLNTTPENYSYVTPVYLTAGTHTIRMESQVWDAPASFGLEIYKNTASEISTTSNINTIFTTASLPGTANVQDFGSIAGAYQYHYVYADGSRPDVCNFTGASTFTATIVNPYIQGYLGNWRPYQTLVYQQSRAYSDIFNAAKSGMDIPNAGFINSFYSYWYYGTAPSGQPGWIPNTTASRWVTANTVTLYDKYGQQLENKDALGRFSGAKFDFNGELPAAVASNAMNREIYASSFEDAKFIPGTLTQGSCNPREFVSSSTGLSIQSMTSDSVSHSGNYSAKLTDSVTLSTVIHTVAQKSQAYLALDANKQYITQNIAGLYPNGFSPYTGKKYVFNAWIKDHSPTVKSVGSSSMKLYLNGTSIPLTCKAIVEGWKLVEGTLDLSAVSSTTLNIAITPGSGSIFIDDIRIHPFDSQIKTYAYDDKTMRLMAELDENGFATFYEYDDEGLLVRVKKETERGIMTLKESRSSYKTVNP